MDWSRSENASAQSLSSKWSQFLHEFPDDLNLRMRRAISWVERAERESDDPDAAFIFFWIAFNAAYAEDEGIEARSTERTIFAEYFDKLIVVDEKRLIYEALWERFAGPIRILLENEFVFQPFWNHHNRIPGNEDWKARFENGKSRIHEGLSRQDTALILNTLFDRLYVLRNQLIHGGATWQGAVNRQQVRDGASIMGFLVPVFIGLMLEHPEITWGPPNYPVVVI